MAVARLSEPKGRVAVRRRKGMLRTGASEPIDTSGVVRVRSGGISTCVVYSAERIFNDYAPIDSLSGICSEALRPCGGCRHVAGDASHPVVSRIGALRLRPRHGGGGPDVSDVPRGRNDGPQFLL